MSRGLASSLAATLTLLWPAGQGARAPAQISPNGTEFQVNSNTIGRQWKPVVAVEPGGAFLVVWESLGSGGSDSDEESIQLRRFGSTGQPDGEDLQINTYTSGSQLEPSIALTHNGEWIAVWTSYGSTGNDDSASSIQARRFSSDGTPLGPEFQVNDITTSNQRSPSVAVAGDGGFLVAWQSFRSDGTDPFGYSIQARRFQADGTPSTVGFQVNSYTQGYQLRPRVAAAPEGHFLVVWYSSGSDGTDSSGYSIQGRLVSSDGTPLDSDFQINTETTGFQVWPDVAADQEGGFFVVWDSATSTGSDSSYRSIHGQRLTSGGNPVGSEFQVNTYTTGMQFFPSAATDSGGSTVVAWQSDGSSGSDTSSSSIQARRYFANGTPNGDDFQVNTFTSGYQLDSSVALDGRGNFTIVWTSDGSSGPDTSLQGILGQRFDALFRDGFESGDSGRWSSTAP